jgi:hypothetical protein
VKTFKIKVILLIIALAILGICVEYFLHTSKKPVIITGDPGKEFLSIPWGCNLEELQKILDGSPSPIKIMSVETHGDVATYKYKGNHRLPSADSSAFVFLKGNLAMIHISFIKESPELAQAEFERLKEKINNELEKIENIKDIRLDDLGWGFYGVRGSMSFELEYGLLTGGCDTCVVLSARKIR